MLRVLSNARCDPSDARVFPLVACPRSELAVRASCLPSLPFLPVCVESRLQSPIRLPLVPMPPSGARARHRAMRVRRWIEPIQLDRSDLLRNADRQGISIDSLPAPLETRIHATGTSGCQQTRWCSARFGKGMEADATAAEEIREGANPQQSAARHKPKKTETTGGLQSLTSLSLLWSRRSTHSARSSLPLAMLSSSDLPLEESERKFFHACHMRAASNAAIPASVFGVAAARIAHSMRQSPLRCWTTGLGVAGSLGALFFVVGSQTCLREFASLPEYPTAVRLRSAIRDQKPAHWLVKRFDTLHPGHDERAISNGATKLGIVPAVTLSPDTLRVLLKESPESQRERDALSDDQKREASSASAADGPRRPDDRARPSPPPARILSSSFITPARSSLSSSSSSASSSDARPPSSFGWGEGDVKRKMVVKRNEFGDEVIEEEEMKPE